MDIPDHIPDVEEIGNAATSRDTAQSIDKFRDMWTAQWTDTATIDDIRDWMKGVKDFAGLLIDKVAEVQGRYPGNDTPEERRFINAHKELDIAYDGLAALSNRGYGNTVWKSTEPRYQKIKAVGTNLFNSAKFWVKGKPETLSNKLNIPGSKDDWAFWKGALAVTLGIVALSTFTDLIKSLKGRD